MQLRTITIKIKMHRNLTPELIFASALRCLAGLRCVMAVFLIVGAAQAQALRERVFSFEYSATVRDIPVGAAKVDLWLPVPHDDPYQKITGLTVDSSYPYKIQAAQYGNRILHLIVSEPKQSVFTVTVRFTALRYEHLNTALLHGNGTAVANKAAAPDPDLARWLQPDRLVPLNDKIKAWAHEVVAQAGAKTDLEKARAIYNHIVATVKYDKSGQGWGRGDIYYACDARLPCGPDNIRAPVGGAAIFITPAMRGAATAPTSTRSSSATAARSASRRGSPSAFRCRANAAKGRSAVITAGPSVSSKASAGFRWMLPKPQKTRRGANTFLARTTKTGLNSRAGAI
jgi:hypothetical protein